MAALLSYLCYSDTSTLLLSYLPCSAHHTVLLCYRSCSAHQVLLSHMCSAHHSVLLSYLSVTRALLLSCMSRHLHARALLLYLSLTRALLSCMSSAYLRDLISYLTYCGRSISPVLCYPGRPPILSVICIEGPSCSTCPALLRALLSYLSSAYHTRPPIYHICPLLPGPALLSYLFYSAQGHPPIVPVLCIQGTSYPNCLICSGPPSYLSYLPCSAHHSVLISYIS